MIHLPYFDIGDLPIWYISPSSKAVVSTVSINRILPSQATISPTQLSYYDQRCRMVDQDGSLPFGIRFAGSPTIHLIDGHHRWYSCLIRGRKRFRLTLDCYDITFAQAVINDFTTRQPVRTKSARRQPVSPQQMSLAF